MSEKMFRALRIQLTLVLFVLGLLSLSACRASEAIRERIVLDETEAVVVAGFRIGTTQPLINASVIWSRFDPPSSNNDGNAPAEMIWQASDCAALGRESSCIWSGYGRFVYRVPPGSYALDRVEIYRRSGSTDISELTRFLPKRPDAVVLTREQVERHRRASPIFEIAAGEVIYLGDFLFLPKFEETRTAGFSNSALYSYELHRLNYDLDAARELAREFLPADVGVEIRRLVNQSDIVTGESNLN